MHVDILMGLSVSQNVLVYLPTTASRIFYLFPHSALIIVYAYTFVYYQHNYLNQNSVKKS